MPRLPVGQQQVEHRPADRRLAVGRRGRPAGDRLALASASVEGDVVQRARRVAGADRVHARASVGGGRGDHRQLVARPSGACCCRPRRRTPASPRSCRPAEHGWYVPAGRVTVTGQYGRCSPLAWRSACCFGCTSPLPSWSSTRTSMASGPLAVEHAVGPAEPEGQAVGDAGRHRARLEELHHLVLGVTQLAGGDRSPPPSYRRRRSGRRGRRCARLLRPPQAPRRAAPAPATSNERRERCSTGHQRILGPRAWTHHPHRRWSYPRGHRRRHLAARRAARPARPALGQGRVQPQGQCGCCTVLVDGQPRVACVTPVARVAGRDVTTVDGLPDTVRQRWGACLTATGGSQCGFCTPGIIVRLHGARPSAASPTAAPSTRPCSPTCAAAPAGRRSARPPRCVAAGTERGRRRARPRPRRPAGHARGSQPPRRSGPDVALGDGGFADDTAPADALVAVRAGDGTWVVGDDVTEARAAAGKVQGRRTTARAHLAARGARGRLGPHAAHHLGRARLPGARRVLVRAGRRAGHRAGQRRRLRRQGRPPTWAPWPGAWPTSTAGPVRVLLQPGGRRAPGSEAPAARRRRAGRRHGRGAGGAHRGHRRRHRRGGARPRGRGGRRGRAAHLRRRPRPRAGPRRRCCWRR